MNLAIFSSISDYRVTGRCKYRLEDLLLVAVLAHLCGGGTPSDMHIFAATRAHEFGLFSETDGTPSADTFDRLVSSLSPDVLEQCVVESGRNLLDTLREKQVVIDGKKLRGTSPQTACSFVALIRGRNTKIICVGKTPPCTNETIVVTLYYELFKIVISYCLSHEQRTITPTNNLITVFFIVSKNSNVNK